MAGATPQTHPSDDGSTARQRATSTARPNGWRGALTSRPAAAHIVLALALSWAVWVPGLLVAGDMALPVIAVGAFGPAAAGAILVRATGGSLRRWASGMAVFSVPARWYLAALAVPLLAPTAQTVVALWQGMPLAPAELPGRLPAYLIGFVFALLLGGGQEEPGWRGYLLPTLLARRDALLSSALIGVVWAVWHLPLFLFDVLGYGDLNFGLYVVFTVAASTVFTWLHGRAGGSVVLAMLLHAGLNSAQALTPLSTGQLDESFAVTAQAAVTVAMALLAAALVARHGTGLGAAYHDETTATT